LPGEADKSIPRIKKGMKVSAATGKIETPDRNVPARDKGIPM
jgi:hypothetical protein